IALFPLAFLMLVMSKVHGLTKNGLTSAYAPATEGLVRANGRLGRVAVAGGMLAIGPGLIALQPGGATPVRYLAGAAYGVCALLNLRRPQPAPAPLAGPVEGLGRVPALALAALGAGGLRAAQGFLLFLLAFALRRSGLPAWWFGVVAFCGVA